MGWNGYVFGVADHGIHLVFVNRLIHPDRWTGDLLDVAANHHPSLLWWVEAQSAKLFGLPAAFGLLHGLSLTATGLTIDLLVRRLGGSRSAALCALLLLAPAQFALGGVPTLDPLLLPRTAALPLELLALCLLLTQRRHWAFLMLGLAACLHAPSAAGLTVAATLTLLVSRGLRPGERLLPPLFFFLGALPVLLSWAQSDSSSGLLSVMDTTWLSIVDSRLAHHISPGSWPPSEWLWMGLWLALGYFSFQRSAALGASVRFIVGIVGGLALWAAVAGSLLARGLHLSLALQLEPWECCRLVTIILACLVGVRAGELVEGKTPRLRLATLGGLAGAALLLSSLSVGMERRWLPDGTQGPERDLAEWASHHLPDQARIAWPPQSFHGERWRANRPGTPTWKDGGEALFDRAIAMRWLEDTRLLCACDPLDALAIQDGRTPARLNSLRRRLETSWNALSEEEKVETAARLGASHIVLSSQGGQAAPASPKPLFETREWFLVPVTHSR